MKWPHASSTNKFVTSFSAALAFWRGSTISWMTYLRMLRERKFSFGWKSDYHYHYLIILSEDSSPGGLSLHLRQSRAHHRSQPWQDVHCPSVVHFPEQLSRLIIGWTMATCLTVYFVDKIFVYPLDDHYRQPPRGGRSVLKIHFFIESGLKMIQFKIKSRIFIQKKYSIELLIQKLLREIVQNSN